MSGARSSPSHPLPALARCARFRRVLGKQPAGGGGGGEEAKSSNETPSSGFGCWTGGCCRSLASADPLVMSTSGRLGSLAKTAHYLQQRAQIVVRRRPYYYYRRCLVVDIPQSHRAGRACARQFLAGPKAS